jgi:hypothetical protein
MSDPSGDADNQPWPPNRMEQHVRQRIRERAGLFLTIAQDDDDAMVPSLALGGENQVWLIVQSAIEEAGWVITPVPERK